MKNKGEIILYHPENTLEIEVRLEDETVWLNRHQMAELFKRDIKTIGKHINIIWMSFIFTVCSMPDSFPESFDIWDNPVYGLLQDNRYLTGIR